MKPEILALPYFDRKLKRLAKKYLSITQELRVLEKELEQNPKLGTDLGAGLYKIRLASKSKGKGKSGGFRIITYYVEKIDDIETVFLVTIYDKSEESAISKTELIEIINNSFEDEDTI